MRRGVVLDDSVGGGVGCRRLLWEEVEGRGEGEEGREGL